MAKRRPRVPAETTKRLRREAGGKCANPGCPNRRSQLHHIKEWAIYQSHDEQHMIAVCATCHDAIHHGAIHLDDDLLYRWKGIRRDGRSGGFLYVEPDPIPRVLLGGGVKIFSLTGSTVFHKSDRHGFSFSIRGGQVLQFNVELSDDSDQKLVSIVDSHILHLDQRLRYREVPGQIKISAMAETNIVPMWVYKKLRDLEPNLAQNGEIELLSLQVTMPGEVMVHGTWLNKQRAIVATDRFTYLLVNHDSHVAVNMFRGTEFEVGDDGILTTIFSFGDQSDTGIVGISF